MFVHETSKATKLKFRGSLFLLLILLILLTTFTILTILIPITLAILHHTIVIVYCLKTNQNVKLFLINHISQPGRAGYSRRRG